MDIYFDALKRTVFRLFDELNESQKKHICNIISNELRKFKQDIYLVEISREPFKDISGPYSIIEVEVISHKIYIRITVD